MEIAKKIKARPDWIIADFGCGENLLAKEISNKVHAFDHVAIDDSVIACDISNVPLNDESVNVVVFCLSLMGCNHLDYFKEAYRVLMPYGHIFICEPRQKWEDKQNKFVVALQETGFETVGSVKITNQFVYWVGIKS